MTDAKKPSPCPDFLEEVEEFIRTHRIHAGRFGQLAMNDAGWVYRLRNSGLDPRYSTVTAVRRWMRMYDAKLAQDAAKAAEAA